MAGMSSRGRFVRRWIGWEQAPVQLQGAPATTCTLVLMGRTGNGKSATGNNILGWKAFHSKSSSSAVTSRCQLESATLPDGRVIRVVDTPGFFEVTRTEEDIKREVVKCLDWAKDGVHALVLVLSTRNRFTAEEMAVVETMEVLFGDRVLQYVVVLFTGGDELEEEDRTLEGYCTEAPNELKQLLYRCGNRIVLFNNKTKDESVRETQIAELLQSVTDMVFTNGGKLYTTESLRLAQALAAKAADDKLKLEALEAQYERIKVLQADLERAHAQQLESMRVMADMQMRLNTEMLEKRIVEEARARAVVEKQAFEIKIQSDENMKELQRRLDEAMQKARGRWGRGNCSIM